MAFLFPILLLVAGALGMLFERLLHNWVENKGRADLGRFADRFEARLPLSRLMILVGGLWLLQELYLS